MAPICPRCGIDFSLFQEPSTEPKPPKAAAFTMATNSVMYEEDGRWVPFHVHRKVPNHKPVHAVMFTDGSVWDVVNGFRGDKACLHCNGTGTIAFSKDLT